LCSVEEKMLESIWKDGMSGQVDSWTPKLGPMQDFNWTWWQWEDNYEMMLEMSDHAHSLKCFLKTIHSSLKIIQMGCASLSS